MTMFIYSLAYYEYQPVLSSDSCYWSTDLHSYASKKKKRKEKNYR